MYASAQPLDFLARTKKSSFPNWKPIVSHPEFPDGNYLTGMKGIQGITAKTNANIFWGLKQNLALFTAVRLSLWNYPDGSS
jgi:hypothetical protein